MQTLNCTVLLFESPIARAYLAVIQQCGFRVKRIIKCFNGEQKWKWMPKSLRNPLLYTKDSVRNNYWPNTFQHNGLAKPITEHICEAYQLSPDFFDIFFANDQKLSICADEVLYCDWGTDGWKSDTLFQLLQSFGSETYLFTGGGLVARRILTLPNTEFVHVHPAVLPYIRGADGLLWSTLLNGKPGASCFYMVPELDEGRLITTTAFEPVQLAKPQSADLKTLYRLIFSFYDPVIRALCLQKVLKQFGTLSHLPTQEQETYLGITYHFMHPLLQEKVLDKIFV